MICESLIVGREFDGYSEPLLPIAKTDRPLQFVVEEYHPATVEIDCANFSLKMPKGMFGDVTITIDGRDMTDWNITWLSFTVDWNRGQLPTLRLERVLTK